MTKQIFFHRSFAGFKAPRGALKSLGVSLLIETTDDPFKLRVTHVYCGRKEKEFSKKKARQLLRDYQTQGKQTVDVYLSGLPIYMADLVSRCGKKLSPKLFDFRSYAFRFVPKAEA